MGTAFIHLGMHKTGTTSIQNTLGRIDMPEHHYIKHGPSNHSTLYQTLFELDFVPTLLAEDGMSDEELAKVRKDAMDSVERELAATTKPHVVFSGEAMSITRHADGLVRMRDFFSRFYDRTVVIGYVRPPTSLMSSVFQQHMKTGRDRFVADPPQYRMRLEKFDKVFGRENVILKKFDRKVLTGGDVALDFAETIGAPLSPDQIFHDNESLTAEAVAVLFARKRFGLEFGAYDGKVRDRNHVVNVASKLDGATFSFASEMLEPVMKRMSADLDWLEERMGVTMRDLPEEKPGVVGSEDALLALAAAQRDALRAMILEEIDAQDDPVRAVAELLNVSHVLSRSRRRPNAAPGSPPVLPLA